MVSHEERLACALQYINGARKIIERCRDPEAQRYWDHLLRFGFIAIPGSTGEQGMQAQCLQILDKSRFSQGQSGPALPIFPLVPEDRHLNPTLSRICDAKSFGAVYRPEINSIFLKTYRLETEFRQGCTFLHEAGHAYRRLQQGKLGTTAVSETATYEELLEEGALHYMEARLWREWGGERYETILQEAVVVLHEKLQGNGGFVRLQWNGKWLNVLDELFGAAPTPKVRHHRMGAFTLHAHFEYIEQRTQGGSKPKQRAEVIRILYKEMKHRQ